LAGIPESTFPARSTESLRVPPHSVEAEQSVLGGLMLDNSAWDTIADAVSAPDFYRRDHRLIFTAIGELAERGEPSDAVTVSEFLDRNGQLDDAGGLAYLGQLARDTPSAANIRAYAGIVRERAMLRELIRIGGEIATSAYQPEGATPASWWTRPSARCSRSPSRASGAAPASRSSSAFSARPSTGSTSCRRTRATSPASRPASRISTA
jgi:hypothetical protein